MKTELKCKGCKAEMPDITYDHNKQRTTWLGSYKGCYLLEWICIECWHNGVKHKKDTNAPIV
jgi:hypothetical protein